MDEGCGEVMVEGLEHGLAHTVGRGDIAKDATVAFIENLRYGTRVFASNDWDATGHAFEKDVAEGLFEGRMDETGGGVDDGDELGVRNTP